MTKQSKSSANMRRPQLLHMTPEGHTIHSYDIEGGQTTFEHFLGCVEGSCEFFKTKEAATNYVYHLR